MVDFIDYIENLEEEEEVEARMRIRKRYIRDAMNPFTFYGEEEFKRRFRFQKGIVRDMILPLIHDQLEKGSNRGLPIPPILQLLLTLRFYATGNFQMVTGDLYEVSQPTISVSVKRVSVALAEKLRHFIKFPETLPEQQNVMRKFHNISRFPSDQACVDGTHIPIRNPGKDIGEIFRNRKGQFSLNVQVAVNHEMKIVDLDVRYPGSTHDNTIFNRSALQIRFENRQVQGLLLGDNGYACRRYLLTPILHPGTESERRYNKAHIATRAIVERTFGVWKRRFPCLRRELLTKLETTVAVICATGILYNISRSVDPGDPEDELEDIRDDVPNDVPHVHVPRGDGLAFRRAFVLRHFT